MATPEPGSRPRPSLHQLHPTLHLSLPHSLTFTLHPHPSSSYTFPLPSLSSLSSPYSTFTLITLHPDAPSFFTLILPHLHPTLSFSLLSPVTHHFLVLFCHLHTHLLNSYPPFLPSSGSPCPHVLTTSLTFHLYSPFSLPRSSSVTTFLHIHPPHVPSNL